MPDPFSIIQLPADAPERPEPLGTKRKFWYRGTDGGRWLFKHPRPDTGEDWAEKVAAELCSLLGLPHARYELAEWKGQRGTVCPTFVPDGGQLIHGNELLAAMVPGYPSSTGSSRRFYRFSQHRLDLVLKFMGYHRLQPPLDYQPPEGITQPAELFVGYLLLDAWIGNQDRHHANWGFVASPQGTVHLAPTFDHASSLGRNETDETRTRRLTTRDPGFTIDTYVEKARSALYAKVGDKIPLLTVDAFRVAAERYRAAGPVWLERLAGVRSADTLALLERVPRERISEPGIEFAQKMLELNREKLGKLREELP